MDDEAIIAALTDCGAAWLMDESDDGCQAKAIRRLVEVAEAACVRQADLHALVARWRAHPNVAAIGSSDRRSSDAGCAMEECADELEALFENSERG